MLPTMDLSKKQTKEERIQQRVARINARKTQTQTGRTSTSTTPRTSRLLPSTQPSSSSSPSQPSPSQAALQSSYAALSSSLTSSLSHLQSFQRARQSAQQRQRSDAQQAASLRQQAITAELASSAATNERLHAKLAELASSPDYATPQQLYVDISGVYREALEVVGRKDGIIRDLSVVLQAGDEEYMAMLDVHEKDVASMCDAMSTSAQSYKAQCDAQLRQLSQTMQAERAALIAQFQGELELLYERRKKMELNRLDHKLQRERREEKELDELRARDLEDYYALKVELESAISTFEQQLEDMRLMYSLNAEKLEYNHGILMERDNDNKLTVDMYRNKMRKMKELVSQLAVKASEAEKRVNDDNRAVSLEYIKLTEAYKGLQKKYAHFITRDSQLYDEIRRMNEAQVMALARKLLHADRVITEQVLGLPWRMWWKAPDPDDTFDDEADIAALTPQAIVEGLDAFDKRTQSGDDGASHSLIGKQRYSPAQVKAVLALLSSECRFLVPPAPTPPSDAGLSAEDEALVYASDAILRAIGCEDDEDVDELCSLFFSSPSDPTINIDRNDVARVVEGFVTHRQASGGKGGGEGAGVTSAQSEKRARRAEKERRYWECLSRVVSDESRRVWEALAEWLVKYNAVLKDREVALRDTGELSRQNEELRTLLDAYTHAKINQELQIPPTTLLNTHLAATVRR